MKDTPYGRVDASRVELPGQQEAYEQANEMQYGTVGLWADVSDDIDRQVRAFVGYAPEHAQHEYLSTVDALELHAAMESTWQEPCGFSSDELDRYLDETWRTGLSEEEGITT